ncbi:unnamed protein product [Pocillopora meandrina]|uniref:G-protein coupled receptors family 1 profile domain-containing protein n=1 Tax=Pocillopora meandrina TaxID=46732 RepID=A0AAU9WW68_9CNID|nr:unnamed protein product [Pocillopora meandrina]
MAISLERLHATFYPFRHRFVRKWVHRAITIVIWFIAIVREAAQIFLLEIVDVVVIDTYLYILFYAVSLLIICVSYILVVIKVRCSRHPQFHSRSKRERKLTGTALIVSLVSLLCLLPAMIYVACRHISFTCLMNVHINLATLILFLANSLVNPIIYALRMPGFREGLLQLVYRVPNLSRVAPANLPLQKMQPFSSNSQCIPWLVVLIIECLAIVVLNIITVVVFMKKKRQLQRQSTYLIIHLAIVDPLVGLVSGPLQIEHMMGWFLRRSRHPQFHSRFKRERKLTGTALIVSLVSLLCLLPAMIYAAWPRHSSTYLINFHIYIAVVALFLANSLVNPIIYTLRMPGLREGLLQLVYRVPDLSNAPVNLPLRTLRRA